MEVDSAPVTENELSRFVDFSRICWPHTVLACSSASCSARLRRAAPAPFLFSPPKKNFPSLYATRHIYFVAHFVVQILDVDNHDDLFDSLDAYCTTRLDEFRLADGTVTTATQTCYLTALPPVLTIQLQRVVYSTEVRGTSIFTLSHFILSNQRNRSEKVNRKLTFPSLLHVDRYMAANKGSARLANLRDQRSLGKTRLRDISQRQAELVNYKVRFVVHVVNMLIKEY